MGGIREMIDGKLLCNRCNEWKNINCFQVDRSKKRGVRAYCKSCLPDRSEYFKKYNKNMPVNVRKNKRESAKKRYWAVDKFRQNTERKEAAEKLTDSYMRRLLARFSLLKESEIPQELIEYKRAIIKIKREIGK